ncbi:hypothetical protein [Neptuniibacter caesariensis]|uniref:DUF4325 domain-containing protein n=1 Tax=Neptuniibacter caesariensis TaxID=207954 RepID=A0A7U8CAV8_NEPCE|nr:hypothetical protein [Neptuniibacter caesariensis]EAR62899.1 hypothetical protein MED92_07266 [Oceanospirillum sp. MED92] [Neptuniibacter caesariensis]
MERVMIIDLNTLKKEGKRLLSGRDNGHQAYELFELAQHTSETKLVLKNGSDLVITNSYFLGMLEEIIKKYEVKADLLNHMDYDDVSQNNRKELLRGINRGFSEIVNPIS